MEYASIMVSIPIFLILNITTGRGQRGGGGKTKTKCLSWKMSLSELKSTNGGNEVDRNGLIVEPWMGWKCGLKGFEEHG